jgi:hypothetical protein
VWFTYTAPDVPTMVSLDTTASTFDTVIGVYTGSSVSGLSPIAGHGCDDGTVDWTFRAKLAFLAQPNSVYRVQVGSRFANFNPLSPGEFVLDAASGASPASATYWANPPSQWLPGQTQTYQAVFTNTGSSAWSASGPTAVHLSVSFGGPSDTPGTNWISEQRFNFSSDVQPNGRAYLTITVAPPPQTGAFVLRHRLVQDNVGWLFGGLKTIAHVSVYCTARPNVVMNAIPGSGQLTVVIAAGGSNSIRSLSIGNPSAPVNALIDAGSQVGVNHPFTVYLGPGSKQMTFVIRRATPGLATTVPFTVQDDCGSWPTLAGGGPNAF